MKKNSYLNDEFLDGIEWGIEQDLTFNPEMLTWDRSQLIEDVADVINDQMYKLMTEDLRIERLWLEKIGANVVSEGKVIEGEVNCVIYVFSELYKQTRVICLTYPVHEGKILEAVYFRDSSGNIIPLNKTSLLNFVRLGITK